MKILKVLITLMLVLTTHSIAQAGEYASKPALFDKKTQHSKSFATVKPSAPIELNYQLDKATYAIGDTVDILLYLNTHDIDPVTATIETSRGLTLDNGQSDYQFQVANNDTQAVAKTINVSVRESGMQYVKITASVVKKGQRQYKIFMIPVAIGPKSPLSANRSDVKIDAKGQKIIVNKASKVN